ncbi:hypothetical protein J4I25_003839 [Salmonella enterica]|uniref:Uncharacterized protein n=2 Tax=Salmonella enterica TaxID=28901 RepID=A0A5V1J0G9_SALER|nr:hypothetical protein [Salmonella enterica]EDX4412620.1 hypothetical protein [Salmonella enterica subsp. houtenae serovar 44:z36,[z38]:-]HAC6492931.1 hypothetical protein [Salmonella enterica subsp. houtenae serovar 44:z36[z38]:-]EAS2170625.1 hypothetical protein [Salmonella enterica]EAY1800631.1 hypothetical protein [Salmonella enterica]
MSKDEISYQILYRYYLEKLHCTLTRRVDNVLSFALMLFGVGVIVNVGNHLILGLCIVGISALKILFRFDTRSAQADRQSRAWLRLFNTRHHFPSDKSLFLAITSLEQDKSNVWSMLIGPAIVMTKTSLGKTPSEKLTTGEKLCAFLSGATKQRPSTHN